MLFALSEITFTIDEALCVVTRFKIKRRLKSENPFKDALDQSENYTKYKNLQSANQCTVQNCSQCKTIHSSLCDIA